MVQLISLCASALLFAASANAHYTLLTPKPLTSDDDGQNSSPCGGPSPSASTSADGDFHVGGSNIGMRLSHPQANWLFRGTLDMSGNGNWTQLSPIIIQNSLGQICMPAIPAPESWVGKKGLIGVVAHAEDGFLYSCAAVNFVAGTATLDATNCKNSTTQIAPATDADLAKMVGTTATSGSTNSTGTAGSAAAATSKPGGAAGMISRDFLPLGGVLSAVAMVAAHLL